MERRCTALKFFFFQNARHAHAINFLKTQHPAVGVIARLWLDLDSDDACVTQYFISRPAVARQVGNQNGATAAQLPLPPPPTAPPPPPPIPSTTPLAAQYEEVIANLREQVETQAAIIKALLTQNGTPVASDTMPRLKGSASKALPSSKLVVPAIVRSASPASRASTSSLAMPGVPSSSRAHRSSPSPHHEGGNYHTDHARVRARRQHDIDNYPTDPRKKHRSKDTGCDTQN